MVLHATAPQDSSVDCRALRAVCQIWLEVSTQYLWISFQIFNYMWAKKPLTRSRLGSRIVLSFRRPAAAGAEHSMAQHTIWIGCDHGDYDLKLRVLDHRRFYRGALDSAIPL